MNPTPVEKAEQTAAVSAAVFQTINGIAVHMNYVLLADALPLFIYTLLPVILDH